MEPVFPEGRRLRASRLAYLFGAPQRGDVMEVVQAVCDAEGAPLIVCGEEITVRVIEQTLKGLRISVTGLRWLYESLTLPVLGRHQAQNAALAIAALEALSTSGVPRSMVERGLARVEWPGRLEVVSEAPLVLMDGGHNAHAVGALWQTLEELCAGRRVHLLIGLSSDKSVEAIGQRLVGLPVSATCTMSRHPRAMDPMTLAGRLAPYCTDVHVMADPIDAYTYLVNAVSPQEVIVVTGSFFLVGELRSALRQSHLRARRRLARPTLAAA